MKKLLFIAAATMLIACEGPRGHEGPMGPQGPQGNPGEGAEWYTTSITVEADEWILSGSPGEMNSYFYAYKELPRLTEYVYNYGSVVVYLQTDDGVKNGMPFVSHRGDDSGDTKFLWTQTYDFDLTPGEIGFYVTYSDFETAIPPTEETFHVVLFWK